MKLTQFLHIRNILLIRVLFFLFPRKKIIVKGRKKIRFCHYSDRFYNGSPNFPCFPAYLIKKLFPSYSISQIPCGCSGVWSFIHLVRLVYPRYYFQSLQVMGHNILSYEQSKTCFSNSEFICWILWSDEMKNNVNNNVGKTYSTFKKIWRFKKSNQI